MTTAINSAISPFAQPKTEPNANAIRFLDEKLASMPASGIPEDFRKLSHFFSVIALVPKSAFDDEATQKELAPNKSVTDFNDTRNVCLPLDEPKAWLSSNAADTFEFGEVKGCLSTMEIHRNGRSITLTRQRIQNSRVSDQKPAESDLTRRATQ